jgi:hypothetical protein
MDITAILTPPFYSDGKRSIEQKGVPEISLLLISN